MLIAKKRLELFCILSVTSAANLNNVLKNSTKSTKDVEKDQLNAEKKTFHIDYFLTVFEVVKTAIQEFQKAYQFIVEISNAFYNVINNIIKPIFKEPELSENKTERFIVIPVNPRVKLNNAVQIMDRYLHWNDLCYRHSLRTPLPPNFRKHVRRISEAECLQHIWEIKATEEIDRRINICRRRNDLDFTRIASGIDAEYGEFPHMGAIGWLASANAKENYSSDYIFLCGSSLISKNFALTAAHCASLNGTENELVQPGALTPKIVRFGVEKIYKQERYRRPQDREIAAFISYPGWNKTRKIHDLALIKLKNPVDLTIFVRPACIVPESSARALRATVSGWGITNRTGTLPATELKKTDVDILDSRQCNKMLRPRMNKSTWNGLHQQICATNLTFRSDACQGDSGGPLQETLNTKTYALVYNVIAVVSFNFVCAATKVPSIYTKIDHKEYIKWIEDNVWGK